ncbi:MAG: lipid-A-disaccharide synthase [Phormidesmis priestleyi Ana]|uniref:Lipid-A-disaccharide synthase n=1 Tax=Phormidesmis priestleyi Ana TaxID=1666911 RepID=A0A0P7ZR04_9CYAN|nr:MAG: lipid-A-disaccharide synthase [Phormidesmis priestleyi Ana]
MSKSPFFVDLACMPSAVLSDTPPAVLSYTPTDVVILTNGPGEVATWVKPVVQAIRRQAQSGSKPDATAVLRISVMLSPCPHASGQEHITLQQYPEVDRVQRADHFFKFLLTGQTADCWDWYSQGIVVFLGGDQLYTVLVAKRLGYRTLTYSEWDARWPSLIDRFAAMSAEPAQKVAARYRHKFLVVGDLMADVQAMADRKAITDRLGCDADVQIIGFLPGSKPIKLRVGMPLILAIAQSLYNQHSLDQTSFQPPFQQPPFQQPPFQYVISVAPNLTLSDLMHYAEPSINPAIQRLNAPLVTLIEPDTGLPYLQIKNQNKNGTENGFKVFLWQQFPALDLLSQCTLCFTTIGANTAQLGALTTPMIVLIPTQELDALTVADGWLGMIARLPGMSAIARKFINPLALKAIQKSGKLFAWPNIWAQREVVPELCGPITPSEATQVALPYLNHPEKLEAMRQTLRTLRGPAGAANKMAKLILKTVDYPVSHS